MRLINECSVESVEKDSRRKRDLFIDPNIGQGVGPGLIGSLGLGKLEYFESQSFPWLLVASVAVIAIFAIVMVTRICRKRNADQESKKEEDK